LVSIGQHLREDLQRGAETMRRTRPAVQAVGNRIEVRLGVRRPTASQSGATLKSTNKF